MPARKTISIDSEAYAILQEEKEGPRSSFSDAIRHLRANRRIRTFGELVAHEKELFGRPRALKPRRCHAKKTILAG
jgi:predicted CopG family antitoxin